MRRFLTVTALLVTACGGGSAAPDASAVDAAPSDIAHAHDITDVADVTDARRPTDVPSRCVDGSPLPYPEAPPGVVDLATSVPDLRFDTSTGSVAMRDWYAPCAPRPRLLLLRNLAAWSGPAQHAAAHTRRILDHAMADRVTLVDLLVLGPDNLPATVSNLARWRERYDAAPAALAVDPGYRFKTLYISAGRLPLFAFVDARSMRVVSILEAPSREELSYEITASLMMMDGLRRPVMPAPVLVDGHFTSDAIEMLRAMTPVAAPTPDPTNRVADDPRAAALGERLFNDTALSSNGMVACATCHVTATGFADGRSQGMGVARGDRNTPTVLGAPYVRWSFWDGRVDTLWAQALGPIENPLEMASSRLAVAHRVASTYATEYVTLFGALPALADRARFPVTGQPGDPQWEAMSESDRDVVNRVFVNVGKSIAAFERTLRPAVTAFDRYAMGDQRALNESQREGLGLFFESGCVQCHHGPMLTDGSFHNIGFPTGRRDGMPDRGRIDAISALMTSPFRSDGMYSDDRTPGEHLLGVREDPSQLGMFRTPTLRGVSRTGPWGHGGSFTVLTEVVRHYARGLTMPPVEGTTGERDVHLPAFHMFDSTFARVVDALNVM